jgi:hypothetical protein
MDKCKNCEWWNRPLTKNHSCDRINHDGQHMFYIFASADDDSNLTANLITNPEFGCNQFKKKEIENG